MTKCWFCDAENDQSNFFCIECGKSLSGAGAMRPPATERSSRGEPSPAQQSCKECHAVVPEGAESCSQCGAAVPRRTVPMQMGSTKKFDKDVLDQGDDPGAGAHQLHEGPAGPTLPPSVDEDILAPASAGSPPQASIPRTEVQVPAQDPGSQVPKTTVEPGSPETVLEQPLEGKPEEKKSCPKCLKEIDFQEGMKLCPFCGVDLETGKERVRKRVVKSESTQRWQKGIKDRAILYHVKPTGKEEEIPLAPAVSYIGRNEGVPEALNFPMDLLLSPRHAEFRYVGRKLKVLDLDSVNGIYYRINEPTGLEDGQYVCMGEQVFRFELDKGGEKPPPPPPDDDTQYFGGGSERSKAKFVKILEDGSDGLEYHFSGLKCIFGRKEGHYVFAQDQLMSQQHAQVYERDEQFLIEDLRSTNGTLLRIREREIEEGTVLRIGEQTFRIDYV